MIRNRNIICLSTPPWEANYASTTVELMKVMARSNKLLFVNNPFTAKDVLNALKGNSTVPIKKVFGIKSRLKKIVLQEGGEVFVLTPPMIIPINFLSKGPLYRTLLKFNGWLVRRTIRRYLKRLQMEQDLINIVSFNPAMGLVNGKRFHERLLLYLCYDEISAAPYLKQHGAWLEKEFMKKADAVIVTSQGLYERKSPMARSCFLVKNAANIQLFSTAFSPENPPKKQVGFIGSIDDRLDYELLEYVIQGMPDTEFIFIGRVMDKKGESLLRKLDNVIFTGPKSLQELPNYVRHFSAGIIPFAKTEFTKGIYPLKINEYLAAGVPVVTTNFSYLNDFEQVVSIAENKEAFKQMLANEISNDSLEKKLARQAVARENTWERRGEELSAIIEELEKFKI